MLQSIYDFICNFLMLGTTDQEQHFNFSKKMTKFLAGCGLEKNFAAAITMMVMVGKEILDNFTGHNCDINDIEADFNGVREAFNEL